IGHPLYSMGKGEAGTEPGFKLGVCDWTLGAGSNIKAFEMAGRIGLDGLQVSLAPTKPDESLFDPQVRKKVLDASRKNKVEIGSVAIGALNRIPYKSDDRAEQWVADSIDVCKALGCRVVLLAFFGKGDLRDDKSGTDVVVERLKAVAPKAEKAGVVFGLESWLSAKQHMDIIDRVGSKAVKVYYDVGNSHKQGYDIYREIRDLGRPYICEFHAKDYQDLYGKGSIDFPKVRQAMDAIGYRGWMHIEGVKMPLGREKSIKYDLEYLREIFPPSIDRP
ncbi:MAG: sugar phosphate isomerase/epimerase family protein, partial [Verrucomicrobiota bacterium]